MTLMDAPRPALPQRGPADAPGRAFGSEGEGWSRLRSAFSPARLRPAKERISDFLGRP